MKHFIYSDDTASAAQGKSLLEVENHPNITLEDLAAYCESSFLKPNPAKTQVSTFHLWNHEAKWKLKSYLERSSIHRYTWPYTVFQEVLQKHKDESLRQE